MAKYNVAEVFADEATWTAAGATAEERTALQTYLDTARRSGTSLSGVQSAIRSKLTSLVAVVADQIAGTVVVQKGGSDLVTYTFTQIPDELFTVNLVVPNAVAFTMDEAAWIAAGGTAENYATALAELTQALLTGKSASAMNSAFMDSIPFSIKVIQDQTASELIVNDGNDDEVFTIGVQSAPAEMFR